MELQSGMKIVAHVGFLGTIYLYTSSIFDKRKIYSFMHKVHALLIKLNNAVRIQILACYFYLAHQTMLLSNN